MVIVYKLGEKLSVCMCLFVRIPKIDDNQSCDRNTTVSMLTYREYTNNNFRMWKELNLWTLYYAEGHLWNRQLISNNGL